MFYPGSKKPFVGNISAMQEYEKVRKTDECVGIPFQWLMENIGRFIDNSSKLKSGGDSTE